MVNNHAAGSDSTASGAGIWYLFPDEPVGPSRALGFYKKLEAKRTPITLFENNVAHSNVFGLAVFRRLRDDHGILGCSTYDPKVVPTDAKSENMPAIFNGFTGKRS